MKIHLPKIIAKNRKYPWEKWTDGQIWKLQRGVDFTPTTKIFVNIAYKYGIFIGQQCRTNQRGDFVYIQFMTKENSATFKQHQKAVKLKIFDPD